MKLEMQNSRPKGARLAQQSWAAKCVPTEHLSKGDKIIINFLLIVSLLMPVFGFAQVAEVPQTMGEVRSLGLNILNKLPEAIKDVWQNQALPIWWNMWAWTKGFWESTLGAKIEMLWQKFLGLLGKESPDIKGEFQKEQQEMQKDLWERFKDLLK